MFHQVSHNNDGNGFFTPHNGRAVGVGRRAIYRGRYHALASINILWWDNMCFTYRWYYCPPSTLERRPHFEPRLACQNSSRWSRFTGHISHGNWLSRRQRGMKFGLSVEPAFTSGATHNKEFRKKRHTHNKPETTTVRQKVVRKRLVVPTRSLKLVFADQQRQHNTQYKHVAEHKYHRHPQITKPIIKQTHPLKLPKSRSILVDSTVA